MRRETLKLFAAGCVAVYLAAYLFLPFLAVRYVGIGLSGLRCISLSFWCCLPLIAGIAMAVCSFVLPAKISGIINIVGAVLPLAVFFIFRETLAADVLGLLGLAEAGKVAAAYALTVGAGVIIALIFGVGAAVLCFLSDNAQAPVQQRTAGFGASDDEDW